MENLEQLVPVGLVALALFVFVGWPLLMVRQRRKTVSSWSAPAQTLDLHDVQARSTVLQTLEALPGVTSPTPVRCVSGKVGQTPITAVLFTYIKRRADQSVGHSADAEGTAIVVPLPLPKLHTVHAPERAKGAQTLSAGLPSFLSGLVPTTHRPVLFTEDPDFSATVYVTGDDEAVIRSAIKEPLRAFLQRHSFRYLTGTGTTAVWWFDEPFDGDGLAQLVAETGELISLLRG